ncbi:3,4-dihydroxy-2-butanone-4-phosphate synthase, partial [bacterium]|nr:3,4-dihydroxy-2-butanone-4-phosphate synthase [bacterium]
MFNTIEEAIKDFREGKPIIVADDEDRENEGDLIVSAEFATPEIINFMASECRGLICLAISSQIAQKLELPQMVDRNSEEMKTAFTVSIDAAEKYGVTTGISAFDRAKTIEVAISDNVTPYDLRRPGHLFPCVAKDGGVLERTGHTETAVDMARLAGHKAAGVMCEIMDADGHMARRDELFEFAKKYNIKFITVSALIEYRLNREKFVIREAEAHLPTKFGDFMIY